MSTVTKLAQLLAAVPILLGALMLFAGIFLDDMFGDMTVVMGVPITLAGGAILIAGFVLAGLVRRVTGASGPPELDFRRRRP